MCAVIINFPRGLIKIYFFDVIIIIAYFYSALSLPPSIVTIKNKDILNGFVVDFRFYVFIHIASLVVMHAKEYIFAHI